MADQGSFEFPEDDDEQLEFVFGDEEDEDFAGPGGHVTGTPHNPDGSASVLTLIPTSTTDPSRPRTLAAGWNPLTQTLTVLFRDSTSWNYYDVSGTLWAQFARAISKGAFIYTYLDPRGASSMGPASGDSATVQAIAAYANSVQMTNRGVQRGDAYSQAANSRRRKNAVKHVNNKKSGVPSKWRSVGEALGYKPGNLGGTGRTRQQKADLNKAVEQYYQNRPGS